MLNMAYACLAGTKTAILPVLDKPFSLALNPTTNKVYIGHFVGEAITIIDGLTNRVDTMHVGARPLYLCSNPVNNEVYVACLSDSSLVIVKEDAIDTVFKFDGRTLDVTLNPATNRIYQLLDNGSIKVIDRNANSVVASIPVTGIWSMCVNTAANKIYATDYSNSRLYVINGNTNTTDTIVPVGPLPEGLAVNPVTNTIYVACWNNGEITIVNGNTYATQTVYGGNHPNVVAVNPSTNKIYVANLGSEEITCIDGSTNTVVSIPTYGGSRALAVNPVTNKVYASAMGSSKVTEINGSTNDTLGIETGYGIMYNIAVNPITNKVYSVHNHNNCISVIDGDENAVSIIDVGIEPAAIAVNPITRKAYVANDLSNNVTEIDGATGNTVNIQVGENPGELCLNPITNKIYASNYSSGTVTAIDGTNHSVVQIPVQSGPWAIRSNPVTNKIYVANYLSQTISVINGNNNLVVATYETGVAPCDIAINSVSNRIYIVNWGSDNVTVVNEATKKLSNIAVGLRPCDAEVNPKTSTIYVANSGSNSISVIDENTMQVVDVPVGIKPFVLGVNPFTNKIFVVNQGSHDVSVIDGLSNVVDTVIAVGQHPWDIYVDALDNKIFITNYLGNTVTVMDGATYTTKTMPAGDKPKAVDYDPVLKIAYAVNWGSNEVMAIKTARESSNGIETMIYPVPGRRVYAARPEIIGIAANIWNPYSTQIIGVMNACRSIQEPWQWAETSLPKIDYVGWSFNWGLDSLEMGSNYINIVSAETQAATINNVNFGSGSPFVGCKLTYPLYRLDGESPAIAWWDSLHDDSDSSNGFGPYPVRAEIKDVSGIHQAYLYWNCGYDIIDSVSMAQSGPDTFTAYIPQFFVNPGDSLAVHYHLKAWDHAHDFNVAETSPRVFWVGTHTGVIGEPSLDIPQIFSLSQAIPNPVRLAGSIRYQLATACRVNMEIYNITGQRVARFDEGIKPPGYHSVKWNTAGQPAGVYFYRLMARPYQGSDGQAGEFTAVRKLVVVK
jgi:YVTN family beta-propeller protein